MLDLACIVANNAAGALIRYPCHSSRVIGALHRACILAYNATHPCQTVRTFNLATIGNISHRADIVAYNTANRVAPRTFHISPCQLYVFNRAVIICNQANTLCIAVNREIIYRVVQPIESSSKSLTVTFASGNRRKFFAISQVDVIRQHIIAANLRIGFVMYRLQFPWRADKLVIVRCAVCGIARRATLRRADMDFPGAVRGQRDIVILGAARKRAVIPKGRAACHILHILESDILPLHGNTGGIQPAHIDNIPRRRGRVQQVKPCVIVGKLVDIKVFRGEVEAPHIHNGVITNQNAIGVHQIDVAAPGQNAQNIRAGAARDIVQVVLPVKGHLLIFADGEVHPFNQVVLRPAGDAHIRRVQAADAHRRILSV